MSLGVIKVPSAFRCLCGAGTLISRRLMAKGTLEQKIQELQRKKSELADAVLAGGAAHDLGLTQADLQAILAPL